MQKILVTVFTIKKYTIISKYAIFCVFSFVVTIEAKEMTVTEAAKAWIKSSTLQSITYDLDTKIHPTELLNIIARHGHLLPDTIKSELENLGFNFSRDVITTDRPQHLEHTIDQGLFRFHYSTTGEDAVNVTDVSSNGIPDYIDSVMAIFATIGTIDFDSLGYNLPPSDAWYIDQYNGGSGHYDIYIFNLPVGYYGYVQGENYAQSDNLLHRGDNENSLTVEQNAMVSFMAIRNNYSDFDGNELENLKVTSAHEFFHTIQYGYDGWEYGWVKEATAVWMEEFIYDEVNDCYQYLPEFFENPYDPFNYDTEHGYGAYIYFSYITEHWAPSTFIKSYWDNTIDYNSWDQDYSIQTLKQTMEDADLDFTGITQNFHIANGLLSSDTVFSIYSYAEADSFPSSNPYFTETIVLAEDDTTIEISSWMGSFASEYFLILVEDSSTFDLGIGNCCIQVDLYTDYQPDTNVAVYMSTIITGNNSTSAINKSNSQQIERDDVDSLILVVSGFNSNYDVINEYGEVEFHEIDYRINITVPNLLQSTNTKPVPDKITLKQNYPNPFNGKTTIDFNLSFQTNVKLDIFDISGRNINTILDEERPAGMHSINWNGKNQSGTNEGSGMYFYRIKVNNYENTRKLIYIK